VPGRWIDRVLCVARYYSVDVLIPYTKKGATKSAFFVTADLLQTNLTQFGLFPATNRDALGLGLFRNHAQQVDA